jgi:hypothetical protein
MAKPLLSADETERSKACRAARNGSALPGELKMAGRQSVWRRS